MRQEEALARISPLRSVSAGRFELESSAEAASPLFSERKDLVLVEPVRPGSFSPHPRARPQAAFLAHLLAVAHRAPQTLEKRRAEPQDAISRYKAAGQAAPVRPGRSLKRAV